MNLLYEGLFSAFLEKAHIERDANQVAHKLKEAYPNCNLPVSKTIRRVLDGETAHPRETLLGFLSAYVLDKREEEVLEADQKNKLGEFHKIFSEQLKDNAHAPTRISLDMSTPNGSNSIALTIDTDKLKTAMLWILGVTVVMLSIYIVLS
jgi:hypothetical protein